MSFPVPLPSTFMPLPLAIMIPFMGIQSGVMAQQFGMNFQYGKRKISAMSNEEFNKLTPEMMQADFANQIKGLIPTFEKSLQDMRPFQRMIFVEMLAVMKTALDLGVDVAKAGLDPLAHMFGAHIHGKGPGGVDTTGIDPNLDPEKFQPPSIPIKEPQKPIKPRFTPPKIIVSGSTLHHFTLYRDLSFQITRMGKGPSTSQKRAHGSFHSARDKLVIRMRVHQSWIVRSKLMPKYLEWLKVNFPK